jgi:hypothetical protein
MTLVEGFGRKGTEPKPNIVAARGRATFLGVSPPAMIRPVTGESVSCLVQGCGQPRVSIR